MTSYYLMTEQDYLDTPPCDYGAAQIDFDNYLTLPDAQEAVCAIELVDDSDSNGLLVVDETGVAHDWIAMRDGQLRHLPLPNKKELP